jgi:hypothetical protein
MDVQLRTDVLHAVEHLGLLTITGIFLRSSIGMFQIAVAHDSDKTNEVSGVVDSHWRRCAPRT